MRSRFAAASAALVFLPGCLGAAAPDRSIAPELRPVAISERSAAVTRAPGFQQWIDGFRTRARAEGISDRTFDRAFRGVTFDEEIISRDRNQAEFSRPIWQYLDGAVSEARINNGRAALREHGEVLERIEARYGVEKEIVVAVWGLESSYGATRGNTPIIGALATLAYDGRRGQFFENQLIGALQIIEAGDVAPENMRGSWAGAMGHTQFIPTSFLAYAVDFTGDGRRDIWSDDPSDSLASTAAYLARHGWTRGRPWGVEVRLPDGFDARAAGSRRSFGEWRAMGVRAAQGSEMPSSGDASLMFPAGAQGPALLVTDNFQVIKRYNSSDSYAIAVGHLSDRLRVGGPFQGSWPRDDRPLSASEREELQRLLTARGFDTGGVDGKVGPMTVAAVRSYQSAAGMAPDGYVSLDLLKRLRR